jgi:hypothetical protein
LELLQFVLLILNTPPPFIFTHHILVHVKSLRSSLGRIWGKQVKAPPLFFRIKIILPKHSHFFCQNGMFNIKKNLLKRWYHVWCLVIQDLSSKFIYCLVLTTSLQLIQHLLSMING